MVWPFCLWVALWVAIRANNGAIAWHRVSLQVGSGGRIWQLDEKRRIRLMP